MEGQSLLRETKFSDEKKIIIQSLLNFETNEEHSSHFKGKRRESSLNPNFSVIFFYQIIPCSVKCFKSSWLFHFASNKFPSANVMFFFSSLHNKIYQNFPLFPCFESWVGNSSLLGDRRMHSSFLPYFLPAYLSLCFCLPDSVASGRNQWTSGLTSQPLTNAHNTHILLSARLWIIKNKTNLYFGNGFPGGAMVKNLPANAGEAIDAPSIPDLKDSLE